MASAQSAAETAATLQRAERLIETGRAAEALDHLSEALAVDPRRAGEVGEIMARAALATSDGPGASSLLAAARESASPALVARINCTTAEGLRLSNKPDEAISRFRRVIAEAPKKETKTVARALLGLAEIHAVRDALAEAASALERALKLDPELAPALILLAEVHVVRREHPAALALTARAMKLDLGPGGLWGRVATILYVAGSKAGAERAVSIALRLDPNDAKALFTGAKLHMDARLAGTAISYLERRLAARPDDVPSLVNLAHCLGQQARPSEAAEVLTRAVALDPANGTSISNLLYQRHHDPDVTPDAATEEALRLAGTCFVAPRTWAPARRQHILAPAKRLRVGYVSADFREHPVAYFIEAVLRDHDRDAIETVLYDAGEAADAMTSRLVAAGGSRREIATLSDDEAARLVEQDEIDILVDLSGHTAGARLGVFARKPAPIQATWLGYFGTTGVREIDYIIADATVLPEGDERHYVERPMRLDPCYLSFTVPPEAPEVAPPPCGADGPITFGCHNRLSKLNDRVMTLWGQVLDAVPGSKLKLRARQFGDPLARERAVAMLAAHGIREDRLILRPPGDRVRILRAYSEMDIALDPFPFAGGTTTAEALWMGVPVVTLRGDRFAGRVSESVLRTVGLSELVAEDGDVYVRVAAVLAADRTRLAELRRTMRERMLASPFMDAAGFARKLEGAYRRMWLDHIGETTERNAA